MDGIQASGAPSAAQQSLAARVLAALKPLESGPRQTRMLDGLRAVAALSVVAYHVLLVANARSTPLGSATYTYWRYLASGVELFFVLSGFLLFLPYARALLNRRALPSARRFYQRRALRILPAYYVCLAILAILAAVVYHAPLSRGDIAVHVFFVHDFFPSYNREIYLKAPFWTLAVEWQFYLLLPLMAWGMSRVVGASRSRWRVVGCLLALIVLAVVLRKVDGVATGLVTSYTPHGLSLGTFALIFVLLTYGMQGKFIEVFAIGMLCSVAYVITMEEQALPRHVLRRLGWASFAAALVLIFLVAAPHSRWSEVMFIPGWTRGWAESAFPVIMAAGYAALLLSAVWSGGAIRAIFEFAPLRFIGLISYSLYLWHLPVLAGSLPLFAQLPFPLVVAATVVVAYLSYQLIERPFLRRKASEPARTPAPEVAAPAPLQPDVARI